MGVVYLAENRLMGRKEVLKVVSSELLGRKGALDRFLQEIRLAAQLNHPNIVTAYSASRVGGSLVFAMQYVEGYDLAKLVERDGPLSVANACNFIFQAARGLQHAHEHGMVHRDIKPSNLMLSRERNVPVVKILDFGLAKVTSERGPDGGLTRQGQMLGTPHYIAPEQSLDAQAADIRADIYGLGCTLYCLLTGHPPFDGPSLYEILQAHHSTDAKPLDLVRPDVPPPLAAVVAKMMSKEPDGRFRTPREVAESLRPFARSRPAGEPPAFGLINSACIPPQEICPVASHGVASGTDDLAKSHVKSPTALSLEETRLGITSASEASGTHPRWLLPALAAGAGLAGIVLGSLVTYRSASSQGNSAPPHQPVAASPFQSATSTTTTKPGTSTSAVVQRATSAQSFRNGPLLTKAPAPEKAATTLRNGKGGKPQEPAVEQGKVMSLPPALRTSSAPAGAQTPALALNTTRSVARETSPPVPRIAPTNLAADPMTTRQQVYASYAAFVARLGERTVKIAYNDVKLRRKYYWEPLDSYSVQLAAENLISSEQLAQLIKDGLEQSWPTERSGDSSALAKMYRRLRTESKLAIRRAEARANMDVLDRLTNMAIQQATAAGRMQNTTNAEAGRRAVAPPGQR
jgi:serine/threonine protein kinase